MGFTRLLTKDIPIFIVASLWLYPSFADSYSPSFNYQGRILNSSGNGPYSGVVDLKLDIYDPSGTCLLYEELQTGIDLISNDGAFSIQVGSPLSSSKRVSTIDPGLNMISIFSNSGRSIRSAGANCPNGYKPSASDARLLRVTVTSEDNQTPTVLSPDLVINTVPYATVADSIQGLGTSDFIRATGTVSNSAMTLLTSGGDATALHNHDSQYVKLGSSSSTNGSFGLSSNSTLGLGSFVDQTTLTTQTLKASDAGKIWYNATTNEVYYWNGSQALPLATAGGTTTHPMSISPTSDVLGLTVKGVVNQTQLLTEWQDYQGNILASLSPSGRLTVKSLMVSADQTGLIVSGNVGIGTTSPTAALQVAGSIILGSSTNIGLTTFTNLATSTPTCPGISYVSTYLGGNPASPVAANTFFNVLNISSHGSYLIYGSIGSSDQTQAQGFVLTVSRNHNTGSEQTNLTTISNGNPSVAGLVQTSGNSYLQFKSGSGSSYGQTVNLWVVCTF